MNRCVLVFGRRLYSSKNLFEPNIEFCTPTLWRESQHRNKLLSSLITDGLPNVVVVSGDDAKIDDNGMNSPRSLPIVKFPRDEIFKQVMEDSKIGNWRKPLVKWFRLGKFVGSLYKSGIIATYRTFKETSKYPSDMGTQLVKKIEYNEIMKRKGKLDSEVIIEINRKEFQEWSRRDEFWKLPAFAILLILIEELALILVYFWPRISPWNCLTPSLYKKITDMRSKRLKTPEGQEYASAYSLPHNDVLNYITNMGLLPRWKGIIYRMADKRQDSAEILRRWHQYLYVDNYFILRDFLSARKTVIHERELVNMILQRQLYKKDEDLNQLVQTQAGKNLLLTRLFIYLSWHFNGTVTVGGDKLFSEKWGINNIASLNYPGSKELISLESLSNIATG